MHVFGPNELLTDVRDRDLCIGCGACVNLCPYFKNHKGKTVMIFPCNLSRGRCYAYCPKSEVDLSELSLGYCGKPYDGSALGHHEGVRLARAGGKMQQGWFQAGGTVSALVTYALESGLIKAAALTDREGLVPTAKLVTEHREVLTCASSKYTAAPTLAAVNEGVRQGWSEMGVVGTPCQLMALAQMRSNPLQSEDFWDPISLVIGLFCTWALDTRKLMTFLSGRVDILRIKGMDIPPPPAEILVIDLGDEKIEIPLHEVRPLVPTACQICPDMTSEFSDVSVGVVEGRSDWNTLILRTQKGLELVEGAVKNGYLVVETMPEANLDHLRFAAQNKKKRALMRAREEGLLNTTEEGKRSVLRIDPSVVASVTA